MQYFVMKEVKSKVREMVIILHLIFIKNYHSASIKVYLKKIDLTDALVIAVVKVFSMLVWWSTWRGEISNIYMSQEVMYSILYILKQISVSFKHFLNLIVVLFLIILLNESNMNRFILINPSTCNYV